MIQIKKTILTLVALFAMTTGAWADNTETVNITAATVNGTNVTVTATGYNSDAGAWMTYDGETIVVTSKDGSNFEQLVLNIKYNEINAGYVKASAGTCTVDGKKITVTGINASSVTFRNDDSSISISSVEVTFAPSSGPEVAWDNDKKTGSFNMPGGNVELEPEYYPQAALATGGAPTAINDVPATTDGAIVNAGTVANIDGTTTAQGTVMYYVSPTALDDAALLALAADQWTADVPTAESFTAAGTAYVYYYVRGNDGDNDDEIFSDGDILSANALTVNIAAAPTYAVTFADGTAEPDEWTASPNTNVKKGQTVTVTYTGTKKVLGVKAEKKAAAVPKAAKDATAEDVGKLIGADGNIYDDAGAATAANTTAVAKIAYVGSDAETSTTYNHGLALALSDVSGTQTWCSQTSSTCLTTQYSSDSDAKADMAGLANTDALVGHGSHTHNAASAARNYNSGTNPTGTSAWFLPSAGQWDKMATAAGGYVTLKTNAGLQSGRYWSSSESSAVRAWNFHSDDGEWDNGYKGADFLVRACLAF